MAAEERRLRERARHWLAFLGLDPLEHEPARVLSGGQRKLLELARVLVAEPRLILLDEPGAGVNPALLARIVEKVRELNESGFAFLVIEHNLDVIRSADYLIDLGPEGGGGGGRVVATGTPIRQGRTIAVWDTKVEDSQGRLVCVSRCTVALRPVGGSAGAGPGEVSG